MRLCAHLTIGGWSLGSGIQVQSSMLSAPGSAAHACTVNTLFVTYGCPVFVCNSYFSIASNAKLFIKGWSYQEEIVGTLLILFLLLYCWCTS